MQPSRLRRSPFAIPTLSCVATAWPFLVALTVMLAVAVASMATLSTLRAYIGGEGLYSKAQRDAVYYLSRYAASGSAADLAHYRSAISVPLGDGLARMALELEQPRLELARDGLRLGGNDPADIEGMARSFLLFERLPPMREAIKQWTIADGYTARIAAIGAELAGGAEGKSLPAPQLLATLDELERLNSAAAIVDTAFSATLAHAARQVTAILVVALVLATVLLAIFAIRIARARLIERASHGRELEASEGRYRAVFESSLDAVVIERTDGSILDANRAACRLFGRDLAELRVGGIRLIAGDGPSVCRETLATEGRFTGNVLLRRKDGSSFTGEVAAATFVDDLGAARVSVIIRDISERRRLQLEQARIRDEAERARRAALETERIKDARFRALIEQSNDMVAVVSPAGEFTYQSPAWAGVLGVSIGARAGSLLAIAHATDTEEIRAAFARVVASGQPAAGRSRLRHTDGRYRMVAWSLTNATHIDGVAGLIVNASDVTSETALAEQLQQARRMEAIGQLAGGIAHDFNNIISSVMGFSELLARDLNPDTTAYRWATRISAAALRARDLVQQILSFARRSGVERAPTDLARVVGEAAEFLRASLPSTTDLKLSTPQNPVVSEVNATQISQLVINLCVNASDALHGKPGRVTVELVTALGRDSEVDLLMDRQEQLDAGLMVVGQIEAERSYARLTVLDEGSGMDPGTLTQIFTPFYTTKQRGRGTGLGLAVVHGIVGEYGGACVVESHVGMGTRFQVFLPLAVGSPPTPNLVASTRKLHGSERVLVIDDEPFLTEILQSGLGRLGYGVSTYNDPLAALSAAEDDLAAIDIVVTDQVMPSLSGLSVLRRLRSLRPDLPVILCTGFTDTQTEDSIRAAGAGTVLYKPLTVDRIAESIRELLDAAPVATLVDA
jgi:PAS domain S-box-containing protein